MAENREIIGSFRYEQDSKRFHRFTVETDEGVTGSIYVTKDSDGIPQKIVLEYVGKQ